MGMTFSHQADIVGSERDAGTAGGSQGHSAEECLWN